MTRISRRAVLAAVGTVGATGALAGSGTLAAFRDTEFATSDLHAGALDLRVECPDGCSTKNGRVSLDLDGLTPGTCGSAELCAYVDSNPAWVWLHAACPPESDVLDAVSVRLTYANGTPVEDENGALSGTAGHVFSRLAGGVRLDGTAGPETPVDAGGHVCLVVEWGVADVTSGGVTTSCTTDVSGLDGTPVPFSLEFGALQARHVPADESPWPDVSCPPRTSACVGCHLLGKYDVQNNRMVVGEEYALGNSGYAILVDAVEDKDDGETVGLRAFRLIESGTADDPVLGPAVCRVDVGGGGGPAKDKRGHTGGGSPNATDDTRYEVCPPTADLSGAFDAPVNNGGQQAAVSNVAIYTCGTPPACW